jgi:CRP-like cAMP-binding protein
LAQTTKRPFTVEAFLASLGPGRSIVRYGVRENLFSQGDKADSVFYLQSGHAKLTVVSPAGKVATVTLLVEGDFLGEEAIKEEDALRTSTATTITPSVALRISRDEMNRVLRDEHTFSDFFLKFILARGVRSQADLVDQLFNSSEKRLARILLLMANYGKAGDPIALIPKVTQETLAEMIGATRSHVSFFMNRFRKLGYIEYNRRIRVNISLLNMVLHDSLSEQNATRPTLVAPPRKTRTAARRKQA